MNRELKFKLWLPGINKMTYAHTLDEWMEIKMETDISPLTWLQYTGLKDKENDKEIYENDIVSFAIFDYNGADTQYKGVVKFSNGQWQLWKSEEDPYFDSEGPFDMYGILYNDDGFEVIGNIYQHPNLLEGTT